jgi:phenylalanyl-tRNA synthetase beta chain
MRFCKGMTIVYDREDVVKISMAWLSKFLNLEGITPEEFAHRLTMSGLEVSNIDNKAVRLNKVITGRLLKVMPHPNADKLSLTEVEVPGAVLKVVCGAKNIAAGDVVPVALEGAVLPGGMEIRRAKIRGEESMGMLCSERELGVADNHEGILHFPADTPVGTPVAQLLGLDDVVLEIEITPNRPDCLSHLGLARHASAMLDRPLTVPVPLLQESEPEARSLLRVVIEPGCGCRRYRAFP